MQELILAEPYRFVKLLGAGGAGEVYLVENVAEKRLEALKVLKQVASEEAERVARGRFKREVTAALRLAHPNIVQTYDCGRLPDRGRHLYITMEMLTRGESRSPSCCASAVRFRSRSYSASQRRSQTRSITRTRRASCTATSSRST